RGPPRAISGDPDEIGDPASRAASASRSPDLHPDFGLARRSAKHVGRNSPPTIEVAGHSPRPGLACNREHRVPTIDWLSGGAEFLGRSDHLSGATLDKTRDTQEQSGMKVRRVPKFAMASLVAFVVSSLPLLAEQIKGEIKSIDRASSLLVVSDEETNRDVVVSLAALTAKTSTLSKKVDLKDLKPGARVVVETGTVASKISLAPSGSSTE